MSPVSRCVLLGVQQGDACAIGTLGEAEIEAGIRSLAGGAEERLTARSGDTGLFASSGECDLSTTRGDGRGDRKITLQAASRGVFAGASLTESATVPCAHATGVSTPACERDAAEQNVDPE
mmetsp:Transcript_158018/g.506818  ORF Transcript_158018/g.506818 Transcript_158018/m.506818 type:complete len:121 (+) Transcript_158018:785-1147(+)